jgi:hypothetical protein
MSEEKIRSIGLKKALFGDINPAGGMPTTMKQLARTMKGTASFVTEADSTSDFYCEEEPAAPVESVPNEAGLKQAKMNLLEWDNDTLKSIFGGTVSETPEDVTIDGKTYSVTKYKAPRDIVIVKKALRMISLHNVVIDIPVAQITARFVWNLTRTDIAQIEVTAKALAPIKESDGIYEVYKLGEPKAGG